MIAKSAIISEGETTDSGGGDVPDDGDESLQDDWRIRWWRIFVGSRSRKREERER